MGSLWDFAIEHLSAVLHSKHSALRAYGIQAIIRLVKSALKQFIDGPSSHVPEGVQVCTMIYLQFCVSDVCLAKLRRLASNVHSFVKGIFERTFH